MPAFNAKGRGGKKKIFDDRAAIFAGVNRKDKQALREAQETLDTLNKSISYLPRLERYPRISLPRPPPATAREQRIMKFWADERKKMRESPLFVRRVVDYGFGSRVKKTAATPDRAGGGFTMLDTYTSKYEKPSRERPNHTGKLWLKEFLPKELWDVVDPSLRGNKKQAATTAQNPNATTKSRFNISAFSDDEDEGSLKSDADDSEAEEDAEAGEQDADMEDDESDNDDYNGEKYFDGGEGDDDLGEGADVDAYGDEVGGGGGDEEREFTRDDEFDVA